MSRAENKAERLLKMEVLLLAHPEGMTQAELARHLGVDRSVIHRNLYDFQKLYPTINHDDGRISLDRSAYLVKVAFTLHEATAIHLAARLMATRMDKHNPHAAAALRKLGVALEQLAPRISTHVKQAADVMDEADQRQDPRYLDVLEKLTLAWAEQRKAKVWHRSEKTKKVYEYLLSIYFIEPYAVGQTTHVIGLDEGTGKMRTLKIERIELAELTHERYEIPADFDPRELLADAWGIWYTENEPVEVVLKFKRGVAQRLQETRWHRSQETTELEDGSVLWKARVAEPQEMIPWIRGWGADCEVLEPEGLREALVREARDLADMYKVMEAKKELFAHIREKDKEPQSLDAHLQAVSKWAGKFADKIGLAKTGEVLGLLHDFGKASEKFQRYLLSGEGLIDPDKEEYIDPIAHKGKIDHTTAGAQVIYETLWNQGGKEKIAAQVLALCIASHHSGLIDCLKPDGENDFKRRMEKSDEGTRKAEALSNLGKIEKAVKEMLSQEAVEQIHVKLQSLKESSDSKETFSFKAGLLVRFLLSCLLDADRLDTADFEIPGNTRIRNYGEYHPWETLIERLDARLWEFEQKENKNDVDRLRSQVSQACFGFAQRPKGIYQLTVPTGGGKTLASLRFALNHAKKHGMNRVFYIIPYTSIIDQNAQEIRQILEDKDEKGRYLDRVVLEHHSNLTPEEESRRHNLLAENWDAPIVLTTQVQFLESLFGAGTRSARRMHQLANSVIILDEVQTVPIKTVHMLNLALRFLVHDCGATVVLCTATQPPLDKLDNQYRALTIQSDQRIIRNEKELFEKLKRVEVFDERKVGGWSGEEVAELAERQLREKGSVLAVVNTRHSARALYQAIADRKIECVLLYHLSTNMCPAHRLDVLDEIKKILAKDQPVICVSTQLIEAGVDIDFGAVIRYLAGLDSIAQSAGRCNRNGHRPGLGNVWMVNPKEESIDRLKDIVIGTEKAQTVLDGFKVNPESFENSQIGLKAMAEYYQKYYEARKDEMKYTISKDSHAGRSDDLFNLLSTNVLSVGAYKRVNDIAPDMQFVQSFLTAAKEFHPIDSLTRGVVVPYDDEGRALIADLCGAPEFEKQYKLLKKAQRYSVNLFSYQFDQLYKKGAIHDVQKGAGVFYLDEQYYSSDFGWNDEPVNDMQVQIL